jgi:hypothetical protein
LLLFREKAEGNLLHIMHELASVLPHSQGQVEGVSLVTTGVEPPDLSWRGSLKANEAVSTSYLLKEKI